MSASQRKFLKEISNFYLVEKHMIVKNGGREQSRYWPRTVILEQKETNFYLFSLHSISDNSLYDSSEI